MIDCKKYADEILNSITGNGWLAVISVGNDPASMSYIKGKKQDCRRVGFRFTHYPFPEDANKESIIHTIKLLNGYADVTGIIVQLPLPKHLNAEEICSYIAPEKDVDGFHPQSVGSLVVQEPGFVSCTPAGIIELLKRSDVEISGKNCVVVGRSNIVGKPMALLMLNENATVTVCHSRTQNLKEICKTADI